jgi:hypothetical protein
MSSPPPTDSGTWDGYDDDYEEEDEAYYAATRRANLIVLGVGLAAALLVLGLIGVLWLLPGDGPSDVDAVAVGEPPAPEVTPAPEPRSDEDLLIAATEPDPSESDTLRTSRG